MTTEEIEHELTERGLSLDIYDTTPWSVRMWARDDPTVAVTGEKPTLDEAIRAALDEWDNELRAAAEHLEAQSAELDKRVAAIRKKVP